MFDVPRSEQFADVYFSADDGPGETTHVFLDGNNLPARWQGRDRFVIGETGFGTGLNFLLAWELFERTAPQGAFLDFVSVEKFPMSVQEIRKGLSPWADRLSPYLEKMLIQYPIRVPGFHRMMFDGRVALTLIFGDANDVLPEIEANVDAWFLDGFTPSKNPDMWTGTVFNEMARLSAKDSTFATFTAAGFVKRGLRDAGFTVEKKKGFGRKRDMLAGAYAGPISPLVPPVCGGMNGRRIEIAGAGLAGCAAAYAIKQYGFTPVLYDPNGIASGASGNPVGIINPRFTAFRDAQSDFYAASFAQTVRTFPQLSNIEYQKCGSLHLITDADKEKRFTRTIENWGWHDDHMRYLSRNEASVIAGVPLEKDALYLPDSARVNPSALCHLYANGIEWIPERHLAADITATALADGLPVETVRGQITYAGATGISAKMKTNICYGGYISAPMHGRHVIGSTFQKWLSDTTLRDEDDIYNLDNLSAAVPVLREFKIEGSRAALRSASKDRFPIIGQDAHGRLVSIAHGSHGIGTSLAGGHLLADYLRGGPFCLGKSTIKALSPMRFLAGAVKKP